MSDKKQYVSFQTPVGKARYPKLDKQDEYKGKEVGYKCGILLEAKDVPKVKKTIADAIKTLLPGGKLKEGNKSPLNETADGEWYIEAKSYKKVPHFMANGKDEYPSSIRLGGGSTIRMKLSLSEGNGHLVAYINSVQIGKLIEKGHDGFDAMDGFDEDEGDNYGAMDSDDGAGDDLDI
jgi:hypothetical protein